MKKTFLKVIALILTFSTLLSLTALFASCGDGKVEETLPEDTTTIDTTVEDTTAPQEELESKVLLADLAKYSLIRPSKVASNLLDKINNLYQKIKAIEGIGYKDDFYKEGVPAYEIGEYEIIVGKTNRPETESFLSDLKYKDFGFALIGKKIVIAGHSDEATINAIDEFISAVLLPKDKEEGVFYSTEYDFLKRVNYNVTSLSIDKTAISEYRVVYPKVSNNSEKVAAQLIADTIASVSGFVIEVVHDGNEPVANEILVGATNRNTEAEVTAMREKLSSTEALIKYDGKTINIFGVSSTAILLATNEFIGKFKDAKAETLDLMYDSEFLCKYDDSILTAMSFNVWVSGKSAERNERVLTMVRNYFPDTVGFQEVDPTWLSTLREGLKDQYAYVGEGRNGGNSGEYNPIFYKKDLFNLIDSGTKWLSDTPDVVSKYEASSLPRIYTYALLERKSDGKRIMVINTHFDHTSSEAREKQAKVLVEYLKKVTDYPIILTGDFNCDSNSSAYSTIVKTGIANSNDIADKKENNSATFTNYGSSNKIIDFVFVSPQKIGVTFYKVCNEEINGDFPSDHHPVLIKYAVIG